MAVLFLQLCTLLLFEVLKLRPSYDAEYDREGEQRFGHQLPLYAEGA